MKRILSITLFVAIAAQLVIAGSSSEQTGGQSGGSVNYPVKNINITVPYDAGSPTDIRTRFLAQELSKKLGRAGQLQLRIYPAPPVQSVLLTIL